MSTLRTFEPRPGKSAARITALWLVGWAGLSICQAWMAPQWAFALSQCFAIAGLILAIFYVLTGLARADWSLAGRALLIGILATTLLGVFSASLKVSASVRLVFNRADYAEAMEAHRLAADPRCDCILADNYGAFRWHRTQHGWRGVMSGDGSELKHRIARRTPLFNGWSLIDLAYPRQTDPKT